MAIPVSLDLFVLLINFPGYWSFLPAILNPSVSISLVQGYLIFKCF